MTASEAIDEIDLKAVVVPTDPVSKELLEYIATRNALADVIQAVESRFRDGEIDLEMFIRLIRRYE